MKHNLLTSANGFCTPPCLDSQRKSTISSIYSTLRTSLLALFLLIVGNSAAWARPTIYGEGLPGLNASGASNWDSNTKEMSAYGEANTYYAEFLDVPATTDNKYRFKIAVNNGGNWWDGAMDSNNVNESMGNVDIVAGNETQISFKMPFAGDVYVFYKSTNANDSKVWIVAVPQNVAAAPNNSGNRRLKTDIMLSGSGWTSDGIKFAKNNDANTYKHVTSYILPAKKSTETGAIRFEMYYEGNTYISGKDASVRAALSTSTPRRIIYLWDGNNNGSWIAYTLPTYPERKSGWKLFVDGYNSGNATNLDANGEATLTLSGGSTYQFFIANTDQATTVSSYSFDIKSYPAVHGVNCFGGCYIDEGNSSNVSFHSQQVYDASKYGTLVKSVIAAQDLRGVFQLDGSGDKDVTFSFDGGKITINAVDHGSTPEPPTPSGVTYDGSEIFYFHKKGGSLNWGTVWANDCALYLLFSNADESSTARSTKIGYFWDVEGTDGNVLATRVPAGTWTKVKVLRNNNGDRGQIWNQSDYATLEEGKDYLDGSNAMAVYAPRTFHFYISGSTTLAETGSDFNAWNGNGTAHSGSMTKTLNAGTYKFKLNPTGTVDWRSEFNIDDLDATNSSNNINLRDGNNKEIWFDLANRSQVTIACDGSKVTVVAVPVQQHTVTFNTNGGSTIDPVQVTDGSAVTQPADPTKSGYNFVKWQLSGSDYNFNTPVSGNITLTAVWAYKAISSISLSESALTTWVGNTDFMLTMIPDPADGIAKSVAWSSDNTSVATVSNGSVNAVSAGTATITCIVTDQFDTQRSATCEVTVAACEMTTDNIYSMTVTGYNSSIGSSATLTGLWNESSENGVMTPTARLIRIAFKDLTTEYMTEDADGKVAGRASITDDSDKWMYYSAGTGFFYLQNYKTGHFLYKDKSTNLMGQNGDWKFYGTKAAAYSDADTYRWLENGTGDQLRICNKDSYNGNLNGSHTLMRYYVDAVDGWNTPYVRCGLGGHQGNNPIRAIITQVEASVANPFFVPSQMNTSYYRMNTNATVQANLTAALVSGATITVRLYADAATSVQLTKANGTLIETISLTADTEREYTYSGSALVGENAFVIKAIDYHAGIASISVSRTYAASPSAPALAWETDLTGGVSQSVSGGTFQHVASSLESAGSVTYSSSDETVATVDASGTVTPHFAGNTTITATIEAEGCYAGTSISYSLTLTDATLQELIDATAVNGTLTLTSNYNEEAIINKPITINGDGHTIGNLTVEQTGDLTLSSGLTVNDFTICAKAGNTSNPAASGQVRNAANLTVNGNAYFLYTVDPSGHVQYGWYDFTVPFPVNAASGIKGIENSVLKENFANGTDYAVMEYLGEKQGQGQYPYKKFSGVMQPNKLYSITLDDDHNYNTLRMQKTTDGALVAGDKVTLNAYAGDAQHQNWNGVGNGTLHHADAGVSAEYIQVYQSGNKTFLTINKSEYSFVVGTAFMVQETGTMTLNQATHDKLLAPKRYADTPATAIQIASDGQPFSDQLFISASETGGQAYTPGVDVAKAGTLGGANVPQIWTNAYNSALCVHEAQLINGEAQYDLSLYAPAAGNYTLTSKNIPADYTLYLTQNGTTLCELSEAYTFDLSQGITTEYGLLLVESHKMPTGIENIQGDEVQSAKIMHNGILYILHNGKVYNAQGANVK